MEGTCPSCDESVEMEGPNHIILCDSGGEWYPVDEWSKWEGVGGTRSDYLDTDGDPVFKKRDAKIGYWYEPPCCNTVVWVGDESSDHDGYQCTGCEAWHPLDDWTDVSGRSSTTKVKVSTGSSSAKPWYEED